MNREYYVRYYHYTFPGYKYELFTYLFKAKYWLVEMWVDV